VSEIERAGFAGLGLDMGVSFGSGSEFQRTKSPLSLFRGDEVRPR
jgi:hypothetical protein